MSKFVLVKCKTGEFVRAVKTAEGYLTGAAVGRPAEVIPFDRAELASAAPAAPAAPVVATIAPTKSGKPRVLTIPKGDTFSAIADALEADAAKVIEVVGSHDVVLRFYADRLRALVNAAPPVEGKADDEGAFRQLVAGAVRDGLREALRGLVSGAL